MQQPKQTSFFKLKLEIETIRKTIEEKKHTFGTFTGIPKLFEFEDVFILKNKNYNFYSNPQNN